MDLEKLILYHESNKSLDSIVDGFERSTFVDSSNDIPVLIKQILSAPKLMGDFEKQKTYNQLQNGGVASTKGPKSETQKKQSFCTEFNQMILNILGLLGFDFSKYLFFLFGLRSILVREVQYIQQAKTYKEILTHTINIRNILSIGETKSTLSTDESPFDIADEFYTSYYDDDEYNQLFGSPDLTDSSNHHYIDIEVKNRKSIVFDNLIESIKKLVKVENILSFEEDKHEWLDLLNSIIDHLIIRSYTINCVDDLILNLTNYNVCYDMSFIKLFDILYEESFVRIPPEFQSTYLPHILFIEKELNLDVKCSKYVSGFNKYFHKTFDEVLKCVMETIPSDEILKLNISEDFYERLSNMTLNLYVQICRKIANHQRVNAYTGRSTRIQFNQVYTAITDCLPQNTLPTISVYSTIYFILLPRKVLHESIKTVCNMN